MPDNVTQREAPKRIYLLDYGSDECTWCEDPSPSGEDHSPVEYVRADTARIAELEREVARLFDAIASIMAPAAKAVGRLRGFGHGAFDSEIADQLETEIYNLVGTKFSATTALGGQP